MATIKVLASQASDSFEVFKREGSEDELYRVREGSEEWIGDLCREAHGDLLPDDHRYEMIHDALVRIANGDEDGDTIENDVPIYNHDRLRWLASNLQRPSYCDEAREDGMVPGDASILDLIAAGYYQEAREVHDLVLAFLGRAADEDEDEDESEAM